MDGAAIEVRGQRVNVIGVDPQQFRSWTPLATASDTRLWEAIAGGDFVSAGSARHLLQLHSGSRYQLAGASRVTLTYGGAATFGIAGVDLVVNTSASASLGLIHNVAALISAPGVAMPALKHEVRAALGGAGRVVSLREPQLPVDSSTSGGKPASLPPAVPRVGGPLLPGHVLDRAGRHRPDRERGRGERRPLQRGRGGPDAVPAVHLAGVGDHRVR